MNRPMPGTLAVHFNEESGVIRKALHSSGFGPTICSQTAQDLADVKSMGFAFARTHDWALINENQRVCDYFHIFPLMHLDASDPTIFNRQAEQGRKLLDGYGFTKCEMIVNEWHYFGYRDYNWDDMQRCSDPAVKSPDGVKKGLLIVDYGGESDRIAIQVEGVAADARVTCRVLDYGGDLVSHPAVFSGGRLAIAKNDGNSAAFFVTFE